MAEDAPIREFGRLKIMWCDRIYVEEMRPAPALMTQEKNNYSVHNSSEITFYREKISIS